MILSGLEEHFQVIDGFYRECLDLLNESSIVSLLNRVAALATSVTNACYCICGMVDDEDEFELDSLALYGFTQVELELLNAQRNIRTPWVENIHAEESFTIVQGKDFPEAYYIFPERKPFISSMLFVPIIREGVKIGSIILLNKIGAQQFSTGDRKLVEILSLYAGFGIYNTLVYDQIAVREETLSKRNEDLALLNELARISVSALNQQEKIIDESMRHVMGYLDIEVGEFFLRDDENPDEYRLVFMKGHTFQTSLFGFSTVKDGEGIVGQVAASGKRYVFSEKEIEVVNQKKATQVQLNYVVILPLITNEGVIGVICLGTKLIGDSELLNVQFISSITNWVATLIQDFRLRRESKRVAILEERQRIGMDLHDGVIQSIYGVGLTLEHARLLIDNDPGQATERIQNAISALNATIRDIRSYIMNLKPERLTNENLIQSLRRLANDFYSNTFINTTFEPDVVNLDGLSEESANTIYLICKEALSNITKHAKASDVFIRFREEQDGYSLLIQDNGSGFLLDQERKPSSHGVGNMITRAKQLGGEMRFDSAPGVGTTLEARLPRKNEKRLS